MIPLLVLSLAAAQEPKLRISGESETTDAGYALAVSGRAESLPDGTVVRLRFERPGHRFDPASRSLEPASLSWVRLVKAKAGGFAHREALSGPGEVGVVASVERGDQDPREAESVPRLRAARLFRAGSTAEVLAARARARKALEEAAASLPARPRVKDLERRAAGVREAGAPEHFPAASEYFFSILSDLASTWESKAHGVLPLPLAPDGPDLLGQVLEAEWRLALLQTASGLRSERRWERPLAALRAAAKDEGLGAYFDLLESFLRAAPRDPRRPELAASLEEEEERLKASFLRLGQP